MSPQRKTIDTFGKKGRRSYVRIVREPVDGVSKIRVLWKEPERQVESFDDTRNGLREAKAFAEGKHEALTAPVVKLPSEPITLRQGFAAMVTAKADEWEDNTLRLLRWRWGKLELFAGRDTLAHTVTRETLDGLKRELLKRHAPNQVRQALKEITSVFRWLVDRDLIPPTKVTMYTTGFKKAILRTGPKMAEYSESERARLAAALDPRKPMEWRAWALNVLFGFCGPRQTAARHLEINDIELSIQWVPTPAQPAVTSAGREQAAREGVDADTSGRRSPVFTGRVHWREETAKNDEDWWQPLPGDVAEAFWVALGWRQFDQYDGRFMFYGVQRRTRGQALRRDSHRARAKESIEAVDVDEKPYTYGALNARLHEAEQRAGIETIKYRSTHGHRRGVGGDMHRKTGSEKRAADWLGDRSVKVVRDHYLLKRDAELAESAKLMEVRNAPEDTTAERHEMQSSSTPAGTNGIESVNQDSTHLNGEPAVGIEPTTARSRR